MFCKACHKKHSQPILVPFKGKRLSRTPPLSLAAFRVFTMDLSRQEQCSRQKRFPSFCFFLLRYTCGMLCRRGDNTRRVPPQRQPGASHTSHGPSAAAAPPGPRQARTGPAEAAALGPGAWWQRPLAAPPGCAAPAGPRFGSGRRSRAGPRPHRAGSQRGPEANVWQPGTSRTALPRRTAEGRVGGGPLSVAILFRWGRERIIKIKNHKLDLME